MLQSGHAARILVERVEKPTDNGLASLLCGRAADADSPETISPRWPRRTSPHPSVRLGPRLLRRKYPVPLLRAGPDAETGPRSPRGHRKGNAEVACESRNRVEPHTEDMTNGRSGIPRAGKWPQLEYSWSVVIQTLRPKESAPASKSSVPIVATLPLHRNAGGIPDLDPDRARTRPIGAVDLETMPSAPSRQA